jgi:hypothetical protein
MRQYYEEETHKTVGTEFMPWALFASLATKLTRHYQALFPLRPRLRSRWETSQTHSQVWSFPKTNVILGEIEYLNYCRMNTKNIQLLEALLSLKVVAQKVRRIMEKE